MNETQHCTYCAKEFEPPDGTYNVDEDPFTNEGWEIAYCCWDCAMLSDPQNMKYNGWDRR